MDKNDKYDKGLQSSPEGRKFESYPTQPKIKEAYSHNDYRTSAFQKRYFRGVKGVSNIEKRDKHDKTEKIEKGKFELFYTA